MPPGYLTLNELEKKQLSYFHKQNNNELYILFSYYFSIKIIIKDQSDVYADLINDAFSIDQSLNHLKIYAPFDSESMGVGHAQFMEITCNKEANNISAKLKIVDSRYTNNTQNNDHDIKIKDIFKNFKDIELTGISHTALGIQNCISTDCNVFTNAFLYLKWKYDVNPEDIKNYKELHKTMKFMVENGVVYKSNANKKPFNFVGKAVNIIGKLSKKVGENQRKVSSDTHQLPAMRFLELLNYKAIEWGMKGTVTLGGKIVKLLTKKTD